MMCLLLFLLINLLTYILMWIDKIKALYRFWRISESTLWVLAFCGGSIGIWLGMQAPLYHKAGKPCFRVGIPILSALWIILIGIYLSV